MYIFWRQLVVPGKISQGEKYGSLSSKLTTFTVIVAVAVCSKGIGSLGSDEAPELVAWLQLV